MVIQDKAQDKFQNQMNKHCDKFVVEIHTTPELSFK